MEWLRVVEVIVLPALIGILGYIQFIYTSLKKDAADLAQAIAKTSHDLASAQLTISQTYATRAEVDKTENRIIGSLSRVEVKLDQLVSRLIPPPRDDG